ncbi:hypothetical protein WJX73_008480 [Symbiochloris irregularis]|uniref:Fungal lipase-type domain-containing protein n=1 Tax=Symbiochloris irregularis TaxID=706552 RepID=A0AAW1PNK0_9CHLO
MFSLPRSITSRTLRAPCTAACCCSSFGCCCSSQSTSITRSTRRASIPAKSAKPTRAAAVSARSSEFTLATSKGAQKQVTRLAGGKTPAPTGAALASTLADRLFEPDAAALNELAQSNVVPVPESISARAREDVQAAEIQTAATFARLSGLCYLPQAELADALAEEGLTLVASGHTHFTRWYVADGVPRALTVPAGLMSMVEELLNVLCPFITTPADGKAPRKITFAGHSLGGSLATLLTCLVRMRLHTPAALLHCFSFGSPPVLALADGSTAHDIVKAVGLKPGSLRSFVLDNDPIPRTVLSFTLPWSPWQPGPHWWQLLWPSTQTAEEHEQQQQQQVRKLSKLHSGWETFHIKWNLQTSAKVHRLAAEDIEETLKMADES